MAIVVVDANVAVKWFIPEPPAAEQARATAVLDDLKAGALRLLEPPHWKAEVIGVIARLRPAIIQDVIAFIDGLNVDVDDSIDIYYLAADIGLALTHHIFDTLYHSVAICNAGTFITADERYRRKAAHLDAIAAL